MSIRIYMCTRTRERNRLDARRSVTVQRARVDKILSRLFIHGKKSDIIQLSWTRVLALVNNYMRRTFAFAHIVPVIVSRRAENHGETVLHP